MIHVSHLTKRFGSLTAVDGVAFDAMPFSITGLLGPNGAGKTTLLKMLSTALLPDEGEASVAGFDIVKERENVRRNTGVLSDQRGLYTRLTAEENVRYYGSLYGVPEDLLEKRMRSLFETLEMKALANRRVEGFSQGEKMKVAIARCLIHDPKAVLLDEPTNGLDVTSVRSLREFLKHLREKGKCLIFSSHVMSEVAALCDRIIVMNHGKIIASGATEEFREREKDKSLEEIFFELLEKDERRIATRV